MAPPRSQAESEAGSMLRPSSAPNQPPATWTEVASFFSFLRILHIQTNI